MINGAIQDTAHIRACLRHSLLVQYEGLRESDCKELLRQVKTAMQAESGVRQERAAFKMFDSWVRSACEQHLASHVGATHVRTGEPRRVLLHAAHLSPSSLL